MPAHDESIVVLGAGLTGGNAAATLRDEGFRGRAVLIGAEPTPPFGRPPQQASTAAADPAQARRR